MKLIAFGKAAEIFGKNELEIEGCVSTSEIEQYLVANFPGLKSLPFRIAVNKTIINEDTLLKGSEEIAILPPFSGG